MAETLEAFTKFIAENKGKRKFKQSVELAVNFKGMDFTKQDNKLNVEIILPNGKGKVTKLAVFASDKTIAEDARKAGVEVIEVSEIEKIAQDQKRLSALTQYDLLAQANLMPQIAKSLGQFLGPRNKMPRPLIGTMNVTRMANDASKRLEIRNRGKNLPTIHCVVGSEDMEPQAIYDNIQEVVSGLTKKVGNNHIKSAYVKLTMSKPMKFV